MKSIKILIAFIFVSVASKAQYKEDHLKNGFEYHTIQMPNDYEGKVVSTLIRKKCNTPTKKAVLYIHGFCDYFFNQEFAEVLLKEGYDFYALDLRKYGRSMLENQHPNQVRNIKEYYADIDSALKIIKSEGHNYIHINAHSTGGLIVARYADARTGQNLFQSISLNSPFLDFNNSGFEENVLVPIVTSFGIIAPKMKLPQGLSGLYGESIHKDYKGEWDFNLNWKPIIAFRMDAGWLRAINKSHKKVKRGLYINEPIIVFSSDKSYYEKTYSDDIKFADAVLDVEEIQSRALKLGKNVERKIIKNGMHDLSLSTLEVRKSYYISLVDWLKKEKEIYL